MVESIHVAASLSAPMTTRTHQNLGHVNHQTFVHLCANSIITLTIAPATLHRTLGS